MLCNFNASVVTNIGKRGSHKFSNDINNVIRGVCINDLETNCFLTYDVKYLRLKFLNLELTHSKILNYLLLLSD